MVDTSVTVDDDSQYFENPRKPNKSATEPINQVTLVSDTLQRQQNNKTHTKHQKLPPYGKEYICFQTHGKLP